ncbi:MAG: hypothetical protein ACI4I9_01720 [Porcipelethomonas sp.]
MEPERIKSEAPVRYTDIFNECFPFYLSIGMTYEQFWEGDSTLPVFYRKAHKLKIRDEYDRINYTCWLQGLYMQAAVSSCFSRKSAYPEKPFELETDYKSKQPDEQQMTDNADMFAAFVYEFNKRRKEMKCDGN